MSTNLSGRGVHASLLGVAAATGAIVPVLSTTFGTRTVVLLALTLALTGTSWMLPDVSIPVAVSTVMFFALVRRIFPSPTPASDVAAIFPFIVAAPLAWRGLRDDAPLSVVCFLAWAAATFFLALGSPLVGLAGIANLAVPTSIGLAAARIPDGTAALRRSLVVSGAVAATYGIVQYLSPFGWDVRWQRDAKFLSTGRMGTPEFRPFATLPSPGTMAVVAAVVVLLVVLPSPPVHGLVRAWAGCACGVILLLTQVRSVWIATAAAVIVAAAGGGRRAGRTIGVVILLGFVLTLVVPSKAALVERAKTLSNPGSDRSYSARTDLLRSAAKLATPFGEGIGQYSAGDRVVGGRSLDNGYLVVLGETGIIGVALLAWVLATAIGSATRRDYPFFVFLLIVNAAGLAIGGVGAILLWSTCGLQRAGGNRSHDSSMSTLATVRAAAPGGLVAADAASRERD